MDRKAKGAAGKISPPMSLNPLSLAHLWDATAPTLSSKDVQCWTVGVRQRSSPMQPKTPSKRPLRMVTGSLGKSSSKAQKTTPSETSRRAAEDRAENIINEIVPTRQVLGALDYSPKHDSAVKGGSDPGTSKKPCSPSPESRVDPPVVSPHEKASSQFTLSDKQAYFLAAKAARRNLARWKHDGVVSTLERAKECSEASPDRLKEWRKAPEQLNEEEKDALQRGIQLAHQKDLEEMEKEREVDESLLVEGDEDSEESDS